MALPDEDGLLLRLLFGDLELHLREDAVRGIRNADARPGSANRFLAYRPFETLQERGLVPL